MTDAGYTILIVDDEPMILDATSAWFRKLGHTVLIAETGTRALELFRSQPVDILLLDLMLPDISGTEVCTKIRAGSDVPVIMLTARSSEDDIIHGLQTGADDYVVKPFSLRELQARVDAVCHRASLHRQSARQPANPVFRMDHERHVFYKNGVPVPLTPVEWKMMAHFLAHPGKSCSRDEFIGVAFDDQYDGFDRAIDTHIKNLRKKLEEDPRKPNYIKTVHGFGYKLDLSQE